MPPARLAAVWKSRYGDSARRPVGYLELVVDDVALGGPLDVGDTVTPFGHGDPALEDEAIDRFLGLGAPDAPGGRTAFYVCPECGDLGCGAITALIVHGPDVVVWRDFGYQTDYEPEVGTEGRNGVGPFTFDATAYAAFFAGLRPARRAALEHPLARRP